MPKPRPSETVTKIEIAARDQSRRLRAVHGPELRERAGAPGVLHLHGEPERGGQRFPQVHVPPAELRRVNHAHRGLLDHPGHRDAHAFARTGSAVILEQRARAGRNRGHQRLRIARRRKAGDAAHGLAEQIGQHHERLRCADIDGDDGPPPRIDVEKGRFPSADRLAGRAFDDEAAREEIGDDEADAAAADAHRAREVGARDRLPGADQVQHDPTVDLARRALRRDLESNGIDFPH